MDRCTKFKIFNFLLFAGLVNFFIYRYYTGVNTMAMSVKSTQDFDYSAKAVTNRETVPNKPLADKSEKEISENSKHTESSKPNIGLQASGVANVSVKDSQKNNTVQPTQSKQNDVVSKHKIESSPSDRFVMKLDESPEPKTVKNTSKSSEGNNTSLPLCPETPPNLVGSLATYSTSLSFSEIGKQNPELTPGGLYKPTTCKARHRVAIIIPYRNREEHLKVLLRNLHPMLIRQQLEYGIYIIDQKPPTRFNRALLMNIGYVEALKRNDYQCAIFHDVDLIPENDKNLYSCPADPRHMSAYIDKFKYKLPYQGIFGGVSALSNNHMQAINGFSNQFFGWGGEDDDMAKRISLKGFKVKRYSVGVARYKMIKHTHEKLNEANPKRFALLKTVKSRMSTDGLNSLKYNVTDVEVAPTHTRIEVFVKESDYKV